MLPYDKYTYRLPSGMPFSSKFGNKEFLQMLLLNTLCYLTLLKFLLAVNIACSSVGNVLHSVYKYSDDNRDLKVEWYAWHH